MSGTGVEVDGGVVAAGDDWIPDADALSTRAGRGGRPPVDTLAVQALALDLELVVVPAGIEPATFRV
jgi:hypothetical protein